MHPIHIVVDALVDAGRPPIRIFSEHTYTPQIHGCSCDPDGCSHLASVAGVELGASTRVRSLR